MRACIYCRISKDKEGEALGVARQEKDCRELAARLGAKVGRVYIDNDLSASTRAKKRRPQYEQMFRDVRDGLWDVIISYSNSRLTRRPLELEDLIVLHERTGVVIHTVVSGQDDLSTADGRMVARIKAAVDAAEAERTGERIARKLEERREHGKPAGGNPIMGYLRADPEKGIGHCQVIDEKAAAALRQAADIILNGGTLTAVRNAWNAAGVRSPQGKEWRSLTTIKRTLTNPRLAGLVVHKGEVVGEGNWPAIFDRDTHEALVRILSTPKNGKLGPRPRRHVLAGFIFCGNCGFRMSAHVVSPKSWPPYSRYLCVKALGGCGKVTRNKDWVDQAVDAYLVSRIKAEYEAPPEASTGGRAAEINAKIKEHEEEIARLRDAYAAGIFTMAEVSERLIPLREQVNALKAELVVAVQEDARPAMEAEDAIALWRSEDPNLIGQRQQLLARYIKRIIVKPLGRIGRKPLPPDCIEIVPVP